VKTIDLRSDTVTRPTPAMREAMVAAAVGDDGFHEDPTVSRLEERAAELLGKEAALYMPSGTMSNLVAAVTFCDTGERLVTLTNAHNAWTLTYDRRLACLTEPVLLPDAGRGLARPDELRDALDGPGANIGLLTLENTFNQAGGTALSPDDTAPHVQLARERGIPIHLDGARIFNAAIALGLPASRLAADVDSVTFCLSKGLCAPVGSVLCGSAEFIRAARVHRQYLGGTMRQAGIVAAAGLLALDTMIDRMAEDHENARHLAAGFATVPGITLPYPVETNLVYIDVSGTGLTAHEVVERLAPLGVRMGDFYNEHLIRTVTHAEISRADCETAVEALHQVVSG
jgi:threonine aldolase